MRKQLALPAIAALLISLQPALAAQNTTAAADGNSAVKNGQAVQTPGAIQAKLQANLTAAGFTNIQVMPSSFVVRAKDKDGNPIVMMINPDSVTEVAAVTNSGSGSSNNTGTNSATNQSDSLQLTNSQQMQVWSGLTGEAKATPPDGFKAAVGETVPSSISLNAVPSNVASEVPAVKPYQFAVLQNQIMLVDPSSKKIVDVITHKGS